MADEEFQDMMDGSNEYDEDINFDFTDALDTDPVPPGEYLVTVAVRPKSGISKKGNPMVIWEFMVSEGKQTGKKIWSYTTIKGQGSGGARDILRGLGFQEEAEGKKPFKPAEAVARQAVITLVMQKNSDEYTEIKKIRPADGSGTDSTGSDEPF